MFTACCFLTTLLFAYVAVCLCLLCRVCVYICICINRLINKYIYMFVYITRGIKPFPSRCPLDKQDCSVEIYFAFSLASNFRFYVLLAAVWRLTHNLYSFAKYSKQNICPRLNFRGDMYTFLKCVCACVCMRIDMGSL